MATIPIIHWIDGRPTTPFEKGAGPNNAADNNKVEKIVAHRPKVGMALAAHAAVIYGRAKGLLEARRNPDFPARNASIIWEKPGLDGRTLDHAIHLAVEAKDRVNRTTGENVPGHVGGTIAAIAIEYGHRGTGGGGPYQEDRQYEGKWILHDAAGLKRRG